jgi:hypothetical protein
MAGQGPPPYLVRVWLHYNSAFPRTAHREPP